MYVGCWLPRRFVEPQPLELILCLAVAFAAGQDAVDVKLVVGRQIVTGAIILPVWQRLELVYWDTVDDDLASLVLQRITMGFSRRENAEWSYIGRVVRSSTCDAG